MEPADPTFYDRANALIQIINSQAQSVPVSNASLSATYSAARFGAWACHHLSESAEEMAGKREEAIQLFTEEFRNLFISHYDDHLNNYAKYR